jgi:GNAT superfamily N-acetyltransferase
MHLEQLSYNDLLHLDGLQPEGWPDITMDINNYIINDFCYPFKAVIDSRIVGIGAYIAFGTTGWLAHIIVDKGFRNQGIGSKIVDELIAKMKLQGVQTVLLIATPPGEPVYIKSGFRIISEYGNFINEQPQSNNTSNEKIVSFNTTYYNQLINLDNEISGENREPLISLYLDNSFVYIEDAQVSGFYIPKLGEGTIIANNDEAGIELMRFKYSTVNRAVIPYENKPAIDYLTTSGFKDKGIKGKRMILGPDISWNPNGIYGRIGGNYG